MPQIIREIKLHMKIIKKINSILEDMVDDTNCDLASYQYNNLAKANVVLDNKKPSPTALFVQVTDFVLDMSLINKREKMFILVSFLTKENKLDSEATAQDEIIEDMSNLAVEFVKRIKADKTLRILNEDLKLKSVFYKSDSNRTGVSLELELLDLEGECL